MAAVPGVERQQLTQCQHYIPPLRMTESAVESGGVHRPEQGHPALMKRIEQVERNLDRSPLRVRKLGPPGFLIRLYCRLVLSQSELEPAVRVHVTVGNVMHQLLYGPAAGTVASLELIAGQTRHGGSKRARCFGDLGNKSRIVSLTHRRVPIEFPDRVPEVRDLCCCSHFRGTRK